MFTNTNIFDKKKHSLFIGTFGCQMNVADSNLLEDLFYQRGFESVGTPEEADLIIVNTCSVRERAELRAKTRLAEYCANKKRHQRLWVVGCMAERMGDSLKKEISGVDLVIGAVSLEYISKDIDRYLENPVGYNERKSKVREDVSALLPVMRGCDNYCTYCIVPFVRGREHSRPAKEIRLQAEKMVERGAREITLLGQNVNSYRDNTIDFADLIAVLHDIEELKRIRFTTSHPKDISDKLINMIADLPKVCKHIHLPVQSGSSSVLKRMNRKYTREHYLERIDVIKKLIPNIDITTDVMVGFPQETESDFQETLSLFRQVKFTSAFMFAFSPRPGTKAAAMPGQVPVAVKMERLNTLIQLQTYITKKKYSKMIGKKVEVLFTIRQDRKSRAWMGQDYGCKRVLLSCKSDLAGMILNTKIVRSTGMTLIAERIEK